MTIEEIKAMTVEQIEERLTQIQTEIDSADAETLDALNAEITAIEERKAELNIEQRKADMKDVIGGAGHVITPQKEETHKMTLEELRSSKAYENAYANYIKFGKDEEVRSMLTEFGTSEGGMPLPTIVSQTIQTAWEEVGTISARINKMNYKGVLKVPFEKSATGAAIHYEGEDAPDEEVLEIGSVRIVPSTIKKWITLSDELLAMDGGAFLQYIYKEIAYRIVLKFESDIIAKIIARSTLTRPLADVSTVPYAEVVEVNSPSMAIFAAMAKLSSDANSPVAIMTKETYFNKIMAAVDSTGRPIYNIVSENGKPSYYVNGVAVLFNDAVGADRIIVGDLSGYTANFPDGDGVKMVTDPYSLAEKDLVKFVGRVYVGHDITAMKHFAIAKLGA